MSLTFILLLSILTVRLPNIQSLNNYNPNHAFELPFDANSEIASNFQSYLWTKQFPSFLHMPWCVPHGMTSTDFQIQAPPEVLSLTQRSRRNQSPSTSSGLSCQIPLTASQSPKSNMRTC